MKLFSLSFVFVSVLTTSLCAQAAAVAPPVVKLPIQVPNVAAQKFGNDGKVNPDFASSHERFVKVAQEGTAELVFLGDSITAGWGGKKEIWNRVDEVKLRVGRD